MLNDIKDSKEKEERTDIYKEEKTKENEKAKFTPSLTSSKEEKATIFVPKLTSDETNIKKNSFTPSNEPSKKEKTRIFTPNTIADPKKKPRNFSPTLEIPEKKERAFKPTLIPKEKKELVPNENALISNLSPKLVEYANYAKNMGKDKIPNPYPNRGTRITDKFKNWIKQNEADPSTIKNLLNQVENINNGKFIQEMIKKEISTTNKSLKEIARNLKDFGLNMSPYTVKNIAQNQVYNNDSAKFSERFPSGTGGFLQENYSLDKKNIAFDNIQLLKEKFIQYHEFAKKNNLQTPYANRGAKITNEFINWIRDNEKNLKIRNQLIKAAKTITKNGEIPQFVMDKTINSSSSMRAITGELKSFGVYLSQHAIGDYARDHVLKDEKSKIDRFPSPTEMIPKEIYKKIRNEVKKYYPIPQRWISKKLDVSRRVIERIAKLENSRTEYERKWPAMEKISEEIRNSVIKDIEKTSLNMGQIGDKFGISRQSVREFAKEYVFNADLKSFDQRFPMNVSYRNLGMNTHQCILDELTRYFNERGEEKLFAEPRIYPGVSKGCDGLILNDNSYLQNRLRNSSNGEISKLIHGIATDSIDNQMGHIKAIQFDFTNDITDQNIINKSIKYERPDLMLYIVGTNWYPYDPIKKLPNDSSILYPENTKVISNELLADFIGLQGEDRNRFEHIINLNYDKDIDSLKTLHEKNNINRNNKEQLREELKDKGLIKKYINEYFKIPREIKKVQKKID